MSTEPRAPGADALTVDVVADLVCPWCYIGQARLRAAADLLGDRPRLRVRHRPFELNPDMPADGMARRDYRVRKFGSWERSLALDARVAAAAEASGLVIEFARMARTPSTFKAHRLLWLHRAGTVAEALLQRLYRAYFVEGRDIGRTDELAALGVDVGLEAEATSAFLDGDEGAGDVRGEIEGWYRAGLSGVPAFIVADRLVAAGAEAPEVLAERLRLVAANPTPATRRER